MIQRLSRRAILALSGATAALGPRAAGAVSATPTPRQTAGPFYPPPRMRPADTDWDLVKVEGQVRQAGGEVLWLFGQVFALDGRPVADALVEIWQCDANGRYHHLGDQRVGRLLDTGFQGFGAVRTGADGSYRFRTIKPVAYPGWTPHIHARVVRPRGKELITQLYLLGDPRNEHDWIYRSLGAAGQAAVSIDPARGADGDLEAGFDFVV